MGSPNPELSNLWLVRGSEGIHAFAAVPFSTTATKVDGGWVVAGRKVFVSLAGAADC